MKFSNLIVSCLFLLIFCSSKNNTNLVGSYFSPKNSKANKLIYGTYALDLKLVINNDSTYVFSTCAQISKGKWKTKQDELILICNERKFIIDSLNNLEKFSKGKICGENEIFLVEKNKLSRVEKFKNGKQAKIILVKDD